MVGIKAWTWCDLTLLAQPQAWNYRQAGRAFGFDFGAGFDSALGA
ncbi:hypothetical protein [Cohaesibacter celericrescens]|nr:hypothetical protein [Cohaesibacter celericrescens]